MVEMLTSLCGVFMASVVAAATSSTHLMVGNSVWVGVSCAEGELYRLEKDWEPAPQVSVGSEYVLVLGERRSNACVCMGQEV